MSTSYVVTIAADFFDNYTDYTNMTDFVPDEETLTCNIKPLEPAAAVTLCVISIAIFLLAVPGNLLVGWVISSSRQSLTPSDMYLFNLTIADGLMSLTIPFWAVSLIQGWIFGDFMCKLIHIIFDANFYTSIIFLACISIDRYLVIVRASESMKIRKRMCSWIVCATVWVFGSALSLPALFNETSKLNNESDVMICSESFEIGSANSWRIVIRGLHHIFGFFLPLAVMVNCYTITIAKLLHTRGFQKHRAMRVIVVVVIAFLLCWTPYHITTMIDTLERAKIIPTSCALRNSVSMALNATSSLALLHSYINPIIYAFVGERFRKKMMLLLERKLRQKRMSLNTFSRSVSQTSEASGAVF